VTTSAAIILYTGNYLDGSLKGKIGAIYRKHAGLCIEDRTLARLGPSTRLPFDHPAAGARPTAKPVSIGSLLQNKEQA